MYVGVWVGMGARSNICVFVYTCVCQYICTGGEMCECMHGCIFYVRAHEGAENTKTHPYRCMHGTHGDERMHTYSYKSRRRTHSSCEEEEDACWLAVCTSSHAVPSTEDLLRVCVCVYKGASERKRGWAARMNFCPYQVLLYT